ncbi:MAG: glycosyltransferase family 2 protein [Nautiliaceae bacterium]
MKISVVVPLMNEEENVKYLIKEVDEALKEFDYELILVDDGSTDNTIDEIKKHMNEKTKLVILNRNYGQTSAMAAGIEIASGDIIVTIDGDLQNDPKDIPMMIEKLKEGYDVVAGIRAKRKDEPFRKFLSKVANKIIRKITGVNISDYGCTLKVFKKDVAKNLGLYGELHRFIPILAKMYGAKITEVPVNHRERQFGKSKYGFNRIFKVISDLMYLVFMQRFGQKPMHFFGTIGFISFSLGVLIDFYLLLCKLFGENIGNRPLLTLGTMLILGGIQLITTGFLAEIMMRTYYESQGKKPYVIKEIISKENLEKN